MLFLAELLHIVNVVPFISIFKLLNFTMVVLLNDPRLLSQVHFVLQEECAHFFCHLLLDILTVTSLRVFLEVGDYLDLLLN